MAPASGQLSARLLTTDEKVLGAGKIIAPTPRPRASAGAPAPAPPPPAGVRPCGPGPRVGGVGEILRGSGGPHVGLQAGRQHLAQPLGGLGDGFTRRRARAHLLKAASHALMHTCMCPCVRMRPCTHAHMHAWMQPQVSVCHHDIV